MVNNNANNANNLDADGERFLPDQMHGIIELEHYHRYAFASDFVANKTVLDIASGEGYGSAYLAKFADHVIGVDISEDAVNHANTKYIKDNLEYRVGSCSAIPLEDHSVDMVISFETIEHHYEHEAMMQEIKRVLRPGGLFIISSPDKLEYSDKVSYSNPFHVKELYVEEFETLLASYFTNIQLYSQKVIYGSAIFGKENVSKTIFQQMGRDTLAVSNILEPLYWIAVVSDEDLPEIKNSIFEQPMIDFTSGFKAEINLKIAEIIKTVAEPDSTLLQSQLNSSWYLGQYPDLVEAGVDVYSHWINHGMAEGRLPASDSVQFINELVLEREQNYAEKLIQRQKTVGSEKTEKMEVILQPILALTDLSKSLSTQNEQIANTLTILQSVTANQAEELIRRNEIIAKYESVIAGLTHENETQQSHIAHQASVIETLHVQTAQQADTLSSLESTVTHQETELKARDEELTRSQESLTQREDMIAGLTHENETQQSHIAHQASVIETLHVQTAQQADTLSSLESTVTHQETELKARDEELTQRQETLAQREEAIATLTQQTNDQQSHIVHQTAVIENLNAQNVQTKEELLLVRSKFDETLEDLLSIKESKCWIYTKPLRDLQKVIKGS